MEQGNKKKKIIVAIIGILVLLVVVVGATYAFFSATDTEESRQITTAKEELDIKINGSTHVKNIKPTSNFVYVDQESENGGMGENESNKDVATIPIIVTNNSSIDINYNLYVSLENLELNDKLIGGTTEDIKWVLYSVLYPNQPELFGDFYNLEKEQKMINEVSIKPGEIHNYVLFVYIEESFETQNKLQNISFDVKVRGDTKPLNIVGRKLTDVILENNIVKDREPNYKLVTTIISNNSKYVTNLDTGLFRVQTEDKNKNIYYFRGRIPWGVNTIGMENGSGNYVAFGTGKNNDNIFDREGKPIYWQILRINEDGSIVLVTSYEYATKNGFKWQTDSGKPDYVGSSIQQELEKWFNNTFSEKEQSMIKETTYCNDRSDNYTAVSKRLNKENPEPTLECKEEKDRITSKIGLLTADEVVMAGLYTHDYINSNNMYFRGINSLRSDRLPITRYDQKVFTMSPISENSYYVLDDDNLLYDDQVNSEDIGYIYPVITLNPNVKISEGFILNGKFRPSRGTDGYPYAIEIEE